MRTTYYPWNVQVLTDWLKLEITYQGNLKDLAAALKVPPHVLNNWLKDQMPTISLPQVRNIAQYRSWSVRQTLDWLELKPAHVEELIAQDPIGDRIAPSDAKALWFGTSAI